MGNFKLIIYLFLAAILVGCVNSAHQAKSSSVNLSNIKKIYVEKFPSDGRGIEKIIANELNSMGYEAVVGEIQPDDIDAFITYRDKWRWDITMYMLSISIKMRDPETGFPLAIGNSLHTSLTRKSPKELVREVLRNMLKRKQV
jgi:hypothetical protein